jgi:hypothetical protein
MTSVTVYNTLAHGYEGLFYSDYPNQRGVPKGRELSRREAVAALAFRGAAVDLGLGALALSPGFGVRAVVGGGVAHGSVFPLDWRTEGLLPLAGELRIALGLQRHEQSCGFYS